MFAERCRSACQAPVKKWRPLTRTVLTLAMFPILVGMYVRLAHREEREVRAEFGEAYARYAATTPAFVPRLHRASARPA